MNSPPASGQADYVPIEALALPGTPAIKGIGKLANMAIDAINPVAGIGSIASTAKNVGNVALATSLYPAKIGYDFIQGFKNAPLKYEAIDKLLAPEEFSKMREIQSLSSLKIDKEVPRSLLVKKYINSSLNDEEVVKMTGNTRQDLEKALENNDFSAFEKKPRDPNTPYRNPLSDMHGEPMPDNAATREYLRNMGIDYDRLVASSLPRMPRQSVQGTQASEFYVGRESHNFADEASYQDIMNSMSSYRLPKGDRLIAKMYGSPTQAEGIGQKLRSSFIKQDESLVKPLNSRPEDVQSLIPALFKTEGNTNSTIMSQIHSAGKQFQKSGKGFYNAAGSISDDSAPLYYSMASRFSGKKDVDFFVNGYTDLNSSGFLRKFGVEPEKVADFMNTHLSKLKFNGKSLPKAFVDENGTVKIPNLLVKKAGFSPIR
jgi:hypothetical protein